MFHGVGYEMNFALTGLKKIRAVHRTALKLFQKIFCVSYFFAAFLRRSPASPASPEPMRKSVAGSGTG